MDYDVRCEGFGLDDELRDRVLMQVRRIIMLAGGDCPVQVVLRQVDGKVQARVEVSLEGRRISAVVWRLDPVDAIQGATNAVVDAIGHASRLLVISMASSVPPPPHRISSHQ